MRKISERLRSAAKRHRDFGVASVIRQAADDLEAMSPRAMRSSEDTGRRHVLKVLQACRGNRSEAARRMGLHRRTLQRWLVAWEERFKIPPVAPKGKRRRQYRY